MSSGSSRSRAFRGRGAGSASATSRTGRSSPPTALRFRPERPVPGDGLGSVQRAQRLLVRRRGEPQDPAGVRAGSFHLHWDGTNLVSPRVRPAGPRHQRRRLLPGGSWYESTFMGAQRENRTDPIFLCPTRSRPGPSLIHQIAPDGVWRDRELRRACRHHGSRQDGNGAARGRCGRATDLWFGGGGAASGP